MDSYKQAEGALIAIMVIGGIAVLTAIVALVLILTGVWH